MYNYSSLKPDSIKVSREIPLGLDLPGYLEWDSIVHWAILEFCVLCWQQKVIVSSYWIASVMQFDHLTT